MVIKVLVFTPDVLTTTEGKRLKTNREETGLYRLLEGGGDSTHRARGYRYVTCDITRDNWVYKQGIVLVQIPLYSIIPNMLQ